MDGAALSVDEIEAIAKLPARNVLDGQLVGVLASPITGLVRGLNQLIGGLAQQLGQIAEQGLVSGEAPAEEAPAAEEAPREAAGGGSGSRGGRPPRRPRQKKLRATSPPRKIKKGRRALRGRERRRASQWQPQPRTSGSKS